MRFARIVTSETEEQALAGHEAAVAKSHSGAVDRLLGQARVFRRAHPLGGWVQAGEAWAQQREAKVAEKKRRREEDCPPPAQHPNLRGRVLVSHCQDMEASMAPDDLPGTDGAGVGASAVARTGAEGEPREAVEVEPMPRRALRQLARLGRAGLLSLPCDFIPER